MPDAPDTRMLWSVGQTKDPQRWSPEVVRALSTRVPFGRWAVTTKCEVCLAVFYPCLCQKDKVGKRLRAPRIVETAETVRLNPGQSESGMGNLHEVKAKTFTHCLDRHRLLVLGKGANGLMDLRAKVMSRTGEHYVVTLDGAEDWSQELTLDAAQIGTLLANLEPEAGEQDSSEAALTLRRDVPLGRCVAGYYQQEADALGDLSLLRVPRSVASADTAPKQSEPSRAEFRYYVCWVKKGGQAEAAGVCPGQVLTRVLCSRTVHRDRKLVEVHEPSHELLAPFCRRLQKHLTGPSELSCGLDAKVEAPCPQTRRPPGGLSWPCAFEFAALPAGWSVHSHESETGEYVAASTASLKRLAALGGEPQQPGETIARPQWKVRFVHRQLSVISRSEHIVRHEHQWERPFLEKSMHIDSNDLGEFWQWGVKAHLCPSQLEFTFKKLMGTLSSDLQSFERDRVTWERTLVQKAAWCAELQATRPGSTAHRSTTAELRALCEDCPLYFLYEVRDACKLSSDLAAGAPAGTRRSRSTAELLARHHGGEGGECSVKTAAETRKRLIAFMPGRRAASLTEALDPTRRPRSASRLSRTQSAGTLLPRDLDTFGEAQEAFQQRALSALGEVVGGWLQEVERGESVAQRSKDSVPGRVPIKWNLPGTQYYKENAGRKDGRLSFDEFVKVLYSAGISWMSKDEMQKRFDALDADQSGFLSLGEVLRASERMLELVRQLREFEVKLDRTGQKKRPVKELLEAFIQRCEELKGAEASPASTPRRPLEETRLPAEAAQTNLSAGTAADAPVDEPSCQEA